MRFSWKNGRYVIFGALLIEIAKYDLLQKYAPGLKEGQRNNPRVDISIGYGDIDEISIFANFENGFSESNFLVPRNS